MKKKGFTLIELLAVLVLLAIIALITIPIVIRTINNSEEQAEKKSILGYARAVEDDIANYMMINAGKKYTDYVLPDNLDYKGNEVECDKPIKPDANGKLKLTCCKVVGGTGTGYDYEKGKVEKSTDTSCNADSGDEDQPSQKTAVQELLSKTNDVNVTTYTSGSDASHQMYTFEHPATEQTDALTDYRYIGNDPYNYVDFNGETWRIIGIFTVEDENEKKEQRIKIIRDESIGDMAWNINDSNVWYNASLNEYLNGDYYNSLSSDYKYMIIESKYYLGNELDTFPSASEFYDYERGVLKNLDTSSINWIGNIGLMYPSDYLYTYSNGIDNVCYDKGFYCEVWRGADPSLGWLYKSEISQWTITARNKYNDYISLVDSSGNTNGHYSSAYHGVRPVTYLKSTVKIASGTGTSSDPYKLKI